MSTRWSERQIGRALYAHVFARRCLICIPNCSYPGSECDLLVVRKDLRMVDVEIKISRSDLKADRLKNKWFKEWDFAAHGWRRPRPEEREPIAHPKNIWKHYYALPRDIWHEDLYADIQPTSGVIVIDDGFQKPHLEIIRHAKPNKSAEQIVKDDLISLAANQNARMWDAYWELDSFNRANKRLTA